MGKLQLKLSLNLKWKLEESPHELLEAELSLKRLFVRAVRQEFRWLLLSLTRTAPLMTES